MPKVVMSKVQHGGETVIPKEVRDALRVEEGNYLVWVEKGPLHFDVTRGKIVAEILPGGP